MIEKLLRNKALRKRFLFTLWILLVYKIGTYVTIPGLNNDVIQSYIGNTNYLSINDFLYNIFYPGALNPFSVFALGILPYIFSFIILQVLVITVPYLRQLKKSGRQGQREINLYMRWGALILAVTQGYGMSILWKSQITVDGVSFMNLSNVGFMPFEWITVITLTAGTFFVIWLGEQITERGICNGPMLIFFTHTMGILFNWIVSLIDLFKKEEEITFFLILIFLVSVLIFFSYIVWMEMAERRIPISYQKTGRKELQPTHLLFKFNFYGIIPFIFVIDFSWMLVIRFIRSINGNILINKPENAFFYIDIFDILYIALVISSCFLYVRFVFKSEDIIENLKKNGGFISGIGVRNHVVEYIQKVLNRMSTMRAVYLSCIYLFPILLSKILFNFYFDGITLLVLIGLSLDIIQQIRSRIEGTYDMVGVTV